jgi:hypothetical protein
VGAALPKESGYVAAFVFLAITSLIAGGTAIFIPKPYRHDRPASDPTATEALADFLGGAVPAPAARVPA